MKTQKDEKIEEENAKKHCIEEGENRHLLHVRSLFPCIPLAPPTPHIDIHINS